MYSSYIMRRTQIYLEERQSDALAQRAAARGTTASKVIREAIDRYLAEPNDDATRLRRYRAALEATFGLAPQLPEGAAYVDDLRHAERERARELDERRRG